MREAAERLWFHLCLTLGRLLRAGRYSTVRITERKGERDVHKQRSFHAPLLVALAGPVMRFLHTGVRILPQHEWEEREILLYRTLHRAEVRIGSRGVLVLPCLPGDTLAALLEDPATSQPNRLRAIELATTALADLHARGFTHGDAMAENVMVDLDRGAAQWFDFETVHDSRCAAPWCRADDVRALLATSLIRTAPDERIGTLKHLLTTYRDLEVTRLVATTFASMWRRSLVFHLGQAALSFSQYKETARLSAIDHRP